jgi:hypothetical protein
MHHAQEGARGEEPRINEQFPVRDSSNLSPPVVARPIHECAVAVWVSGFVPWATVRVYANGSHLVGQATSPVGFLKVPLTRSLVLGEVITATQTVGTITSGPSYDHVPTEPYPALTRPVVGPDLYDCGRIVPVGNLVASTHVEVSDQTAHSSLGGAEATGDWEPVVTSKLVHDHLTQAVQIACPHVSGKTTSSPPSQPVKVLPEPARLSRVVVDKPVVGTDVVTLHNLLVGAEVEIKNGPATIGSGLATARDNWARVSSPIPAGTAVSITATQKLCSPSQPSDPVHPTESLPAPHLGAPICEGSRFVTVDGTVLNANVVLLRAGHIIGYGGAVLGTLRLAAGAGVTLTSGDVLTVIQYIGTVISPASNPVTVGCGAGADVVTQHNDNFRTGAYLAETTLTPAKVLSGGMRVKYQHPLDGSVAAQPLFVRDVAFPLGRAHGLFVATMANKVYGLDADTGAEQWVTVLTDRDPGKRNLARGVSSTPVIDVPNHRMYVLFSTKNQPQDGANCPDSTHPSPGCGTYEDQLAGLILLRYVS